MDRDGVLRNPSQKVFRSPSSDMFGYHAIVAELSVRSREVEISVFGPSPAQTCYHTYLPSTQLN